jgi:predicted DNA-binding transcriptional regulator AlpA
MNSSDLSIENINEKELIALIEKGRVDLAILKSRNLATIENLDFLFLVDRVTIRELATYWDMNRMTVYRKIIKNYGSNIVQVRKVQGNNKTITVSPKIVFDNTYDYEEFLKWRATGAPNEKKTVSIPEAMEITGVARKKIIKLIKKDKLVAIKKNSGTYEIVISSLLLYLFDYLIIEKKRMEKAVKYLNANGSTINLKLHLNDNAY